MIYCPAYFSHRIVWKSTASVYCDLLPCLFLTQDCLKEYSFSILWFTTLLISHTGSSERVQLQYTVIYYPAYFSHRIVWRSTASVFCDLLPCLFLTQDRLKEYSFSLLWFTALLISHTGSSERVQLQYTVIYYPAYFSHRIVWRSTASVFCDLLPCLFLTQDRLKEYSFSLLWFTALLISHTGSPERVQLQYSVIYYPAYFSHRIAWKSTASVFCDLLPCLFLTQDRLKEYSFSILWFTTLLISHTGSSEGVQLQYSVIYYPAYFSHRIVWKSTASVYCDLLPCLFLTQDRLKEYSFSILWFTTLLISHTGLSEGVQLQYSVIYYPAYFSHRIVWKSTASVYCDLLPCLFLTQDRLKEYSFSILWFTTLLISHTGSSERVQLQSTVIYYPAYFSHRIVWRSTASVYCDLLPCLFLTQDRLKEYSFSILWFTTLLISHTGSSKRVQLQYTVIYCPAYFSHRMVWRSTASVYCDLLPCLFLTQDRLKEYSFSILWFTTLLISHTGSSERVQLQYTVIYYPAYFSHRIVWRSTASVRDIEVTGQRTILTHLRDVSGTQLWGEGQLPCSPSSILFDSSPLTKREGGWILHSCSFKWEGGSGMHSYTTCSVGHVI